MKIIYLGRYNETEILSGPEKVAKRLFHNVCSSGLICCFVTYFFEGSKYSLWQKLFGKQFISDSLEKNIQRMGLFRLLLFLIKERPDIIHIITFERFTFIALLYKIFNKNVKIVYTVHGVWKHENKNPKNSDAITNFKNSIIEWALFNYSDLLFLLSNESLKIYQHYYKQCKIKTYIIENGIDNEFCSSASVRTIEPNRKITVVMVGGVERSEKGMNFLLKAISDLEIPIDIFNISDSNYVPETINNHIKVFTINKMETNKFAGFLQDKDIFISSSEHESFSISMIEAMAAGLIPLSTKQTGASSFINDGENGFIFDYGDTEKPKQILLKLYNEPELRKSVSENAAKIYKELSWDKIAEKYLLQYSRVI